LLYLKISSCIAEYIPSNSFLVFDRRKSITDCSRLNLNAVRADLEAWFGRLELSVLRVDWIEKATKRGN